MKKLFYVMLVSFLSILLLVSCESQKPKTEVKQDTKPQVKSEASDSNMAIDMINRQVKDFAVDGFPGGSSKLKKNKDLENMKKIVGLVKPIVESIPDGYVMQITGHAANYESKKRQQSVSTQRAAKIYSELKKAGVPAAKMSYKGVGTAEPIEGYSDKDPRQRSVSFKAIKK